MKEILEQVKSIYALLAFSAFVVVVWYSFAAYMIYIIGNDAGLWKWCWLYIDKWIRWRYGFGT